jgi:hypothetical protein
MAKMQVMKKDLVSKPGQLVIEVLNGKKGKMTFDPTKYPKSVQDKLPVMALNHMLGDAAAGKQGAEAEENIWKKHEALLKGEMTTRAPAAPKIKLDTVAENYKTLPDAKKEAARALLESLGIQLPI